MSTAFHFVAFYISQIHCITFVSYSATTGKAIYLLRSARVLVKHVELIDPQLLKLRSARLVGLPLLLNREI